MSTSINLYFWSAPFDDGDGDGPVRSIIHVHKRAQYADALVVDWPAGADMVEIVVPGVGTVRLQAAGARVGGVGRDAP